MLFRSMEMRILSSTQIPQRGDILSNAYPDIIVDTVDIDTVEVVNFFQWEATVNYKDSEQVVLQPAFTGGETGRQEDF